MEKNKLTIKFLTIFSFAVLYFGAFPIIARAANIYFSPSSGSHETGDEFTVALYVKSADQAINAASGIISFQPDKLEVASLSKNGSIFSLWVRELSFSNSGGTINFEGVVLNPGFTGSAGKIISVNFKVKAAGNAVLNFSSGAVLANDGKGTNILSSSGNAQFSLVEAVSPAPEGKPSVDSVEEAETPAAPQLFSSTHADPDKWYALSSAEFFWDVPSGFSGVRTSVDKNPHAVPTVTYATAINSKKINDVPDGVWYFHVRLRNEAGWGGVSHFRFQIDTEKPTDFVISELKRNDPTEPRVEFIFDAKDESSGIDHYEVRIDGAEQEIWKDDGSKIYATSALASGRHTLIAKAVDASGNALVNFIEFIVEPLSPPIATEYPRQLTRGENLIFKGATNYPNSRVIVWFEREKKDAVISQSVKSDDKGNFVLVAENKLSEGIYKVWAEVIDERGARSNPSEKVAIAVEQPRILRTGSRAVSFLAVVVPLVALIVALAAILWYSWHKLSLFRKKVKKEVREAEHSLHKAFSALKKNVQKQMKLLEAARTKRQLTDEEEKIIRQFSKSLDDAEQVVKRELEGVSTIENP